MSESYITSNIFVGHSPHSALGVGLVCWGSKNNVPPESPFFTGVIPKSLPVLLTELILCKMVVDREFKTAFD